MRGRGVAAHAHLIRVCAIKLVWVHLSGSYQAHSMLKRWQDAAERCGCQHHNGGAVADPSSECSMQFTAALKVLWLLRWSFRSARASCGIDACHVELQEHNRLNKKAGTYHTWHHVSSKDYDLKDFKRLRDGNCLVVSQASACTSQELLQGSETWGGQCMCYLSLRSLSRHTEHGRTSPTAWQPCSGMAGTHYISRHAHAATLPSCLLHLYHDAAAISLLTTTNTTSSHCLL